MKATLIPGIKYTYRVEDYFNTGGNDDHSIHTSKYSCKTSLKCRLRMRCEGSEAGGKSRSL